MVENNLLLCYVFLKTYILTGKYALIVQNLQGIPDRILYIFILQLIGEMYESCFLSLPFYKSNYWIEKRHYRPARVLADRVIIWL
jgi:hypothetical protein